MRDVSNSKAAISTSSLITLFLKFSRAWASDRETLKKRKLMQIKICWYYRRQYIFWQEQTKTYANISHTLKISIFLLKKKNKFLFKAFFLPSWIDYSRTNKYPDLLSKSWCLPGLSLLLFYNSLPKFCADKYTIGKINLTKYLLLIHPWYSLLVLHLFVSHRILKFQLDLWDQLNSCQIIEFSLQYPRLIIIRSLLNFS